MNKKLIEVVPYNTNWPQIFETEAEALRTALADNCIAVHHIGSTSVSGLSAKPIIDIIAEVKNGQNSISSLEKVDFTYKGEWNIPFKFGFSKRDGCHVNLHVYEENHPEIQLNLVFRDYLRNHPEALNEYQNLKTELLQNEESFQKQNGSIFTGYNLGKDAFIRKVLEQSGFKRLRFLRCTHNLEWQEYHRIRKEQIFDHTNIQYDENHPTINDPNHFHFILCKGTKIVSIAQVEFLNDFDAALRALATDSIYQNQSFGTQMLQLLEKWLKLQGKKVLKMHADLKAENFYRKYGYVKMVFADKNTFQDTIDLGKIL
jgi:GrpB-like predicted nucleotidyltransferase (UPF0157 family)/GNAT superfamily N-acetyltransferase